MTTLEESPATVLARHSPLFWMAIHAPESVPADYADYHDQLAAWPDPGEKQARVVFRGAAKSTITTGLVLWAIHTARTSGLVWVRATESDCMGDREALDRLGSLAGMTVEVRASQQMVLVNGVPVWTKTPRGAVRGIKYVGEGGQVFRPDTAIVDDLETRVTARSKDQTDRLQRWMMADLFGTAGRNRPLRVVFLGTPITPNSLIARAMRREPPFDTWLPPLVVPIRTDTGAAWPAMAAELDDLERTTDDYTWSTEFLLQSIPEGSLIFPPGRTRWTADEPGAGRGVWIGVDPSGGAADNAGIVAAHVGPTGLVIPAAECWKGRMEDTAGQVAAMIRRLTGAGWQVYGVNVEGVGAWQYLANDIAATVAPIPVVTETPVVSKLERALPAAAWQKAGAVTLVDSLRGSLFDVELHSWTVAGDTVTGHDDMPDAFVWAGGAATGGWSAPIPVAA